MCVKIIHDQMEYEFNPAEPLEFQIMGAKKILVDYDESDSRIETFVNDLEFMANNGISCDIEIKVNTNNTLDGIKLERVIEKLKTKLDVNEVIKGLAKFHAETDSKLCEISNICFGENE